MPKQKFTVYLSACSNVGAKVDVEAESSEEAAELAVKSAESGDVVWDYNGVDDGTIEVSEVQNAKG